VGYLLLDGPSKQLWLCKQTVGSMQGSKHSSIYPGIFHLSRKINKRRNQGIPLSFIFNNHKDTSNCVCTMYSGVAENFNNETKKILTAHGSIFAE
jgi:hypothetical protein